MIEAPASATPYARVMRLVAGGQCVVLDGGVGTELISVSGGRPEVDEELWGAGAIVRDPQAVRAVHLRYVAAGCDVITTDTWGLATAIRRGQPVGGTDESMAVHWLDVAREAVTLARDAVADAGRGADVAVAFSVNGDVDSDDGSETIRLLSRAFQQCPPDLILLETLSLVRASTFATVTRLLDTGVPVWVSFRRCRHGVCGVYGEHWGGPEGDAFGRAARRFEEMGVGALGINCIPPDHVTGMVSWLRDFTDLPLGVYPNLGYLSAGGWRSEIDPATYSKLVEQWRAEGAQIIGGCCGVGPDHIAAAAAALTAPSVAPAQRPETPQDLGVRTRRLRPAPPLWADGRGHPLFPLEFPEIHVDDGVFVPTQGSLYGSTCSATVWEQTNDALTSGAGRGCYRFSSR